MSEDRRRGEVGGGDKRVSTFLVSFVGSSCRDMLESNKWTTREPK